MAPYIGNKFTDQDSAKLVGGTQEHRSAATVAPLPWRQPRLCTSHSPLVLAPGPSSLLQKEFEKRVDPNDRNAQALLDEMRQHIKKASSSSLAAGAGCKRGWQGAPCGCKGKMALCCRGFRLV